MFPGRLCGSSTAVRVRRSGWLLAACMAALAVTAQAASAGPGDATRGPSLLETQLTLQVLRALNGDPALAPHNLGARVRDRVATLLGSVPTQKLADQAVAAVREVKGIREVRSELEVAPAPEDPNALRDRLSGPPAASSTGPLTDRRPPGDLTARPGDGAGPAAQRTTSVRAHTGNKEGETGLFIDTPPALGNSTLVGSVTLGAPLPLGLDKEPKKAALAELLPPRALPRPADLAAELSKVRSGDARFVGVQARVEAGVVYVRTGTAGGEDMFDFALAVSRITGVRRVVIENSR
jgi:hypothetical protein